MTGDAVGIIRLHRAEDDADAILRRRVAVLLEIAEAEVLVGRSCPRCGSSTHGRPWARPRGARREVFVSITRSGEHLMTAVTTEGPVGVDLESIAAVSRGWDPALVLHPSERSAAVRSGPRGRAALWARKEAVLKALGTGLETPMNALRSTDFDVVDLSAPSGHVAALARLWRGRRPPSAPASVAGGPRA
ncbi:MAG: 4'-phosphopantetheinyl transferase superfamily protein [Brachybacterium sp.]|uniref:4'-phosphopantetheinyl transferase family protein n=1 Tax=Brachybacterium sp. TaxID=1891286 RepID=UPI00264B327F|nr:4'-phosphopantetheinyl transferase superfamily protein [Brachybacterium sp.]